jgi:uncharacterized lipoprotein YmbA
VLTGCSFLKPAQPTERYFVLTPQPPQSSAPAAHLALGVGKVKIPTYLWNTSVAVRKGAHEIQYLPAALWAERLDAGFQRVLAANLAAELSTDRIFLSSWEKPDVSAEVYVSVEQFDVDTEGRGTLVAHWRLQSPGGEKLLQSGASRLTHQGPAPAKGAPGLVATLSELVVDLSRQLAQVLKENRAALLSGS